ncbi:MAG: AAA family ATPase, partial [Candidatus Saccharimonadales bacterium]
LGVQHKNFAMLFKACQAREVSGNRLNIWLYGPAGTGKTHAAHAVASALSLPFQSNGTMLTEYSLSGFIDAGGRYHRTAFREIFEHGGVYLGDEYDAWDPKAAMYLQAALSNGYTRFPDGMVKRHSDAIIIFGANTVGKGATAEYSTRNKIDDANGNRMVYIPWPLDEALELAISPDPKWTARVQVMRSRVRERALKGHLITPRQALQGAALLQVGLEWEQVEEMVLRRGLSDDHWESIRS